MRNFHFGKICGLAAVAVMVVAGSAVAGDYPESAKQQRLERSGAYMSTQGSPVENTKSIPCNGLKDCREKGHDLDKVSAFEGADYSSSQYPGSCKRMGVRGYEFHPSAC